MLWILTLAITMGAVIYQRAVGPTRPVRGTVTVGSEEIHYRLDRSHGGDQDHRVSIEVPESLVLTRAELVFRRYKTDDPWSRRTMVREGNKLSAMLPSQPPGGKLVYRLQLTHKAATSVEGEDSTELVRIPAAENVVIRFRGAVPAVVMIPHVIFMFAGMIFSNRAGLEAVTRGDSVLRHSSWALSLLGVGGLILGPAVQWYAFGEAWTGFPVGYDLTDNKTLVAAIFWVLAVIVSMRKWRGYRGWAIAAALVTLVIFSIPHSVLGTELDYESLPAASAPDTAASFSPMTE